MSISPYGLVHVPTEKDSCEGCIFYEEHYIKEEATHTYDCKGSNITVGYKYGVPIRYIGICRRGVFKIAHKITGRIIE